MRRRLWFIGVIIWLMLTVFLLTWANLSVASSSMSPSDFQKQLKETLEKYPEIVLDILRENSEFVLDIAQQGANQRRNNVLLAQWEYDAKIPKEVLLTNRPMRGDVDAPVTIVSFSDFTCSYCKQAAATVQSLIEKNKGKVRYVFKHYPLETHGDAHLAAQYHIATSMQDQAKSWQFYDRVFIGAASFAKDGEAFLKMTAKDLGFDMQRLAKDIKGRTVRAILDEDRLDAERIGVKGTPFFLVNNLVIRGALPFELFNRAISVAGDKVTSKK